MISFLVIKKFANLKKYCSGNQLSLLLRKGVYSYDYPLAPERIKIGNIEKLISYLNNKTNYVMHYENFKLYESLVLKITKIHRGIKFKESA